MLYSHIASPSVVTNFPALARRIANKELPHGADVIVGIHARLLKESHPLPFKAAPPNSMFNLWGRPEPVKMDVTASDGSDVEDEDETVPSQMKMPSIRSTLHPSGSEVFVPRVAPQPTATAAPPNFPSGAKGRGKRPAGTKRSTPSDPRTGVSSLNTPIESQAAQEVRPASPPAGAGEP